MPPRKKKKAEPRSRGLTAAEVREGKPSPAAAALAADIEKDGGAPLGVYRDPLGGHWQFSPPCLWTRSIRRPSSATSPKRTSSG